MNRTLASGDLWYDSRSLGYSFFWVQRILLPMKKDASSIAGLPPGLCSLEDIPVRALYLGERIRIRDLESISDLSPSSAMVPVGEQGMAMVFRYGAVVLVNMSGPEEDAFLGNLQTKVISPLACPTREQVRVCIDPAGRQRVQGETVFITQCTPEHIQLIGEVLARSVALDHYEHTVAAASETVQPLAEQLKNRGRWVFRARMLLKHIGQVLVYRHAMVGRMEVTEKPELLWEVPDLERIYMRLAEEFEIRERHLALERKLNLISLTSETVLEILQTRRALRLELYIVILIIFEILLTLYEMFLRH